MTLPVSRTTEEALRQALARLIDGCPTRTDGRLTVANLAREAGMSRATANRATAIVAACRDAIAAARARGMPPRGGPEKAREERRAMHIRAQHIQASPATKAGRAARCAPLSCRSRETPMSSLAIKK
jgi:hypothetical protein